MEKAQARRLKEAGKGKFLPLGAAALYHGGGSSSRKKNALGQRAHRHQKFWESNMKEEEGRANKPASGGLDEERINV